MEVEKISNGLTLLHKQLHHTHSVSMGLYIKAGSKDEREGKDGLTHLLEHMHFRRLKELTQKELYAFVESLGTSLRGKTYKDLFCFTLKIRPLYVNEAMDVFVRILDHAEWTEEDLEKERGVVLDQILQREYDQSLDYYMDQLLWKGHPLGRPIMGTSKTVSSLTIQDLINHKKRCLQPDNLVFVMTGNFTDEHLHSIKDRLEGVSFSYDFEECAKPTPLPNRKGPEVRKVNRNWNLSEVCVAFDIDSRKVSPQALTLLNSILGEGIGSRLQLHLREERGIATDIESYIEYYEDASPLFITFSAEKEHLKHCFDWIVQVLKRLKTNIKEADLTQSLPFYTENLFFLLDDTEELNREIAHRFLLYNERYDIEREMSLYKKVTRHDLMELAKSIFKKEKVSIVIMGDCNGVNREQIRSLFHSL